MGISWMEEVVVGPEEELGIEAVVDYWRRDVMEAAIALPFPELTEMVEAEAAPQFGIPAWAPSRAPEEELAAERPCFVTTTVTNLNVFPQCTVGKMYMTFGDKNYVGSAWAVGESAIFTAGHCVHDKSLGGWARNLLFAGRYHRGSYVGRWAIPSNRVAAPKGWVDNRDFKYDMAVGIASSPIRPKMGKLGWMANYPANQGPYTELGYPLKALPGYSFDGEQMWQCVGDYVDGTEIIQACGNMTGGCSGGPWTVERQGHWRANGLNSHRYGDSNRIFSPYFGDAFLKLIDWMKKNGGD